MKEVPTLLEICVPPEQAKHLTLIISTYFFSCLLTSDEENTTKHFDDSV